MAITAKVIPGYGLIIEFSVTGNDEKEVRAMFNEIDDGGDISVAMKVVLQTAIDRWA